jgi:deoxyribodipyrimidine photo-lyase
MPPPFRTSLVWFRRDLRLADHVALERAARASERIVCAFVLDPSLLRGATMGPPIVAFFFDSLAELRASLRERGSDLALLEGDAGMQLLALAERTEAQALFFNVDYEPFALERDRAVGEAFRQRGLHVESSTDHVIFGSGEILKADGSPYTVFTPYKRRWLEALSLDPRPPVDSAAALASKALARHALGATREVPAPEEFAHQTPARRIPAGERRAHEILAAFARSRIASYAGERNLPAASGTSQLSPHVRAGTIGIRTCVRAALEARDTVPGAMRGAETWLGELIWRDFYQQILAHFPHVVAQPFLQRAKSLRYRRSQADFKAWCEARTGYPLVDAAMTQLNQTGWMHNRLRMIVASFLAKDLLLDYRLGERYFEQRLADADVAANNGGWQWAASTGTDAAPYFRVFNPVLQSRKFDPDGVFIRSMLPALAKIPAPFVHEPWTLPPLDAARLDFRLGRDYPDPIIDHARARERALALYAPVFGKSVS